MLRLPPSVRVFVCQQPTDMRKSFDSLCGLVHNSLRQDPFAGHLFVFFGKRGDRIKVLWWDRSGFALFYKRLEQGVFPGWSAGCGQSPEISAAELALLLEGVEPAGVKRHRDMTPQRPANSRA